MKVRFWVVSAKGTSLRDSLNSDLTKIAHENATSIRYAFSNSKKSTVPKAGAGCTADVGARARSGIVGTASYRFWNVGRSARGEIDPRN